MDQYLKGGRRRHKNMATMADADPRDQITVRTSDDDVVPSSHRNGEIIGGCQKFRDAFGLLTRLAVRDVTILLLGETGVGKEVFAKEAHRLSKRRDKPFVAVNCAAIPSDLLESELFGVEKGAFTGASVSRAGRFEKADGGTIFLDEIGEMPVALQAKLLRILQEKTLERVGGGNSKKIDVRVIAATNIDLAKSVASGQFRADLFYRINVCHINIPPLRDRLADMPLYVDFFLRRFSAKHNRQVARVNARAMSALMTYEWPGNIRELSNVIERAVVLSDKDFLDYGDLVFPSPANAARSRGGHSAGELLAERAEELLKFMADHRLTLESLTDALILRGLEKTDNNITATAKLFGLSRSQIAYRIKKISMSEPPENKLSAPSGSPARGLKAKFALAQTHARESDGDTDIHPSAYALVG